MTTHTMTTNKLAVVTTTMPSKAMAESNKNSTTAAEMDLEARNEEEDDDDDHSQQRQHQLQDCQPNSHSSTTTNDDDESSSSENADAAARHGHGDDVNKMQKTIHLRHRRRRHRSKSRNVVDGRDGDNGDNDKTKVKEVTIVIAHCGEDLMWLTKFGPNVCRRNPGVSFYIQSKCPHHDDGDDGDDDDDDTDNSTNSNSTNSTTNPTNILGIVVPSNVRPCTTVNTAIKNCGTEEYAYFQYIDEHYDNLPSMMAFIQGGALTENPHLWNDILMATRTPHNVSYRDLARHVSDGWHMRVGDPAMDVDASLMNQSIPTLSKERVWKTSWRGMFMVSRSTVQRHPRHLYNQYNTHLCQQTCLFRNCIFESVAGPFFGCSDIHYMKHRGTTASDDILHDGCVRQYTKGVGLQVDHIDFIKDSIQNDPFGGIVSHEVTQITCPRRTILYAQSVVNGLLMCFDRGYEDDDNNMIDDDEDDDDEEHGEKKPIDNNSTSSPPPPRNPPRPLFTESQLHMLLSERTSLGPEEILLKGVDWKHTQHIKQVETATWNKHRPDVYDAKTGEWYKGEKII